MIRSSWIVPSPSGSVERRVDQLVLVDERQPVEARRLHEHVEMIAGPGAVDDAQIARVGEGIAQQRLEALHRLKPS